MHSSGKCLISAVLGLILAANLGAAPKSDLWARWQAYDPAGTTVVDNDAWDRFLSRYLDSDHPSGINRVDYGAVSGVDKQALAAYLNGLQALAVSALNRDEQMAYWINLYNAATVKVILDHYPVSSITRINLPSGLLSRGPWDAKILKVEGEEVSLNDVEHRILRPIWKDPRVHYAVNCASLGCPNLQNRSYTSENIDALLEKGAREYINHPRGVSFQGKKLILSGIYEWFQEDFGGTEEGVLEHLRRYAAPQLAGKLESFSGRIGYGYDWSLNE